MIVNPDKFEAIVLQNSKNAKVQKLKQKIQLSC